MRATAEFVVPRSIPITGPLIFFLSSAYPLRNCEVKGALKVEARGTTDVARGNICRKSKLVTLYDELSRASTYAAPDPCGKHGDSFL